MSETEGATFWVAVFTDLRHRGGQDCFVAGVDGLTGLPDALETIVPRTQVQRCIVHNVRQSLRDGVWRERRAVARDLRALDGAPTGTDAEAAVERVALTWAGRDPTISTSWRRDWPRRTGFFDDPSAIRKVIDPTNAIASLNYS